jgi:hypothetical protein
MRQTLANENPYDCTAPTMEGKMYLASRKIGEATAHGVQRWEMVCGRGGVLNGRTEAVLRVAACALSAERSEVGWEAFVWRNLA